MEDTTDNGPQSTFKLEVVILPVTDVDRAGAVKGLHLVVRDIEVARDELSARGVDCSDFFHFTETGQSPGLHPDRADYGTFVSIEDPDGNGWLLQEVGRGVGTGRVDDPDRAGRNAGHAFARALETKDWPALTALFADEVDVKGLTPGRHWDAATPQALVDGVLTSWFEDSDHIDPSTTSARDPTSGGST